MADGIAPPPPSTRRLQNKLKNSASSDPARNGQDGTNQGRQ